MESEELLSKVRKVMAEAEIEWYMKGYYLLFNFFNSTIGTSSANSSACAANITLVYTTGQQIEI